MATAPTASVVIPRQSTCVAIGGRGVLIEGGSGTGKSSLALALIDRGATLVGDDSVMLTAESGQLIASPHSQTRGLLEVRNLGLLSYPVAERVMIALVIRLDPGAPRFIEQADSTVIAGIALPMIALWPDSPVLAIRAELALARFGLPFAGAGEQSQPL